MKPSNQLIMEMAKDKATALIIATALVKAGANVSGVQSALLAQFGE